MIVGTTPSFLLRVTNDEIDFNEAKEIYFTIRQGSIKYTKTGEDIKIIDKNILQVNFTQEETLTFRYNLDAEVQLNWLYEGGKRVATKVKKIALFENLIREVL